MHVSFDLEIMQINLQYDGECELAVEMGMFITEVLDLMKSENGKGTLQKLLNFIQSGKNESVQPRPRERQNQNNNFGNQNQFSNPRFDFDLDQSYTQERRRSYPQQNTRRYDRTSDSQPHVQEDRDSSPPVVTIPRRSSNHRVNNSNGAPAFEQEVHDRPRYERAFQNGNAGYSRGRGSQGNRNPINSQDYRRRQEPPQEMEFKEPSEADDVDTYEEEKQKDLYSIDVIIEDLEKGGPQMEEAMERLAFKLKQNEGVETEFVEKLVASMLDKTDQFDCLQSLNFLKEANQNRGENNQFEVFGRGKPLVRSLNHRLKVEFERAVGGFGSDRLQRIAFVRVLGQDLGIFDFFEIMEEVVDDYLDPLQGFEKFCAGLHQICKFIQIEKDELFKTSDFASQIFAICEHSKLDKLREQAGQDAEVFDNLVQDIRVQFE
eukprot:TRINITY_DN2668_c0_g3_i2.p1 TRINITY_DN2668_c0_g3~~TRINITY_DN2668_c0_g3_i2.p1  ORF type:complete len:433 (-),score=63.20 TRINITY_DN2668_c0_g3_i2:1464-2762(-)